MKMTAEHYKFIKSRINYEKKDVLKYKQSLKSDPRVKDIDKRLRWDLFNMAIPVTWVCDNLYSYLDDNHIDTALKKIMKELYEMWFVLTLTLGVSNG